MTIAPELLRRIVEGALLAAGQPLSEEKLLSLIDEGERPEKTVLRQVLEEIAGSCAERGFELRQVASGWRYQVPEDLAPWVNRLWEEKPQKYSRAILETLAIIAYRQPITRGDIEEIRGVAVSSHIVRSLSERGWIKVVGQRDVPGKPSLYATTREFLDYFNLSTLDDLPTLAEIRDIDSLNQVLDLGQLDGGEAQQANSDADSEEPAAESIEAESAGSGEDTGEDAPVEVGSPEEVEGEQLESELLQGSGSDLETAAEAGFTDSESEEVVEDEFPEAADSSQVSEGSLTAELPPSSLFVESAESEEPAEAEDEAGKEPQSENATL
ncbi:SMC-Scp complex subunit ScpB [Microbulbifer rhizosphaerae]|uniref:Segregation and condensation protein B n=1 Tax=Microbulbifer rhizosphaerae TaxID=1562603 RepID=A0A7W4W9L8_9GAMM|nr:SMC-Scp complex subunit ScpB [Microbulbifer rhizosphaerae]MBB3060213.1 segregation and condensation protein B [Microbulbifer rhizosphaerae]